jgi:hypothetical protein
MGFLSDRFGFPPPGIIWPMLDTHLAPSLMCAIGPASRHDFTISVSVGAGTVHFVTPYPAVWRDVWTNFTGPLERNNRATGPAWLVPLVLSWWHTSIYNFTERNETLFWRVSSVLCRECVTWVTASFVSESTQRIFATFLMRKVSGQFHLRLSGDMKPMSRTAYHRNDKRICSYLSHEDVWMGWRYGSTH